MVIFAPVDQISRSEKCIKISQSVIEVVDRDSKEGHVAMVRPKQKNCLFLARRLL